MQKPSSCSPYWRSRYWRYSRDLLTVTMAWLMLVAPCFAQTGEESEEKSYVPNYMIIIFAVGLALLIICRAGKRTTSFRHDD